MLVKTRWAEISEEKIPTLIQKVSDMAEKITEYMEVDAALWGDMGLRLHKEPDHLLEFTSYKQHVDHLIKWMEDRKTFLDKTWSK